MTIYKRSNWNTATELENLVPTVLAKRNPRIFCLLKWLVDPTSHLERWLQQSFYLFILSSSGKHIRIEWSGVGVGGSDIYLARS